MIKYSITKNTTYIENEAFFGMKLLLLQIFKRCFCYYKSFLGEVGIEAEAHNEIVEIKLAVDNTPKHSHIQETISSAYRSKRWSANLRSSFSFENRSAHVFAVKHTNNTAKNNSLP